MSAHTQGPLHLSRMPLNPNVRIVSAAGHLVVIVPAGGRVNAEDAPEIVRRWNAHEELVAALKHVADCIEEGVEIDMSRIRPAISKATADSNAAAKLAFDMAKGAGR